MISPFKINPNNKKVRPPKNWRTHFFIIFLQLAAHSAQKLLITAAVLYSDFVRNFIRYSRSIKMKNPFRTFAAILLVFAFAVNALPCGPAFVTPVFEYKYAPENPFENFAAGKIGIVKPTLHRSVLIAAYRYVSGGSFDYDEQKSLVEVWKADFSNEDFRKEDVTEAVKSWLKRRKEVVKDEEKAPDIYTERDYGGYDFFPNCTKSSFDTAAETLANRISSYGSDDKNVLEWTQAQDAVFTNCASGRQIPAEANAAMPEWLRKDRAYQLAAAEFYSLNYAEAKRRFAEISEDGESVWQETADYLVGRTLIRQASLSKSAEKSAEFYAEAEQRLENIVSRSGKFAASAELLLGLIKYRLHPQERVSELAQKISFQSGNQNFRQDVIDYTWLLDKFEKEALETEEKKKEEEKKNNETSAELNMMGAANSDVPFINANSTATNSVKKNENDLQIYLYADDYSQNWNFFVRFDATDEQALAEAERVVGKPLTEEMKKRVTEARKNAYSSQFNDNKQAEYQGGYFGSEERSLSILPEFLRRDDLTDWLFAYQIKNTESYLYALSKYRQSDADLWLMAAISKADKNSTELKRLLDAAGRMSRSALAYPTVAYHAARIYIEQGKHAEAVKILDEILNSTVDLPISSRNQFLELRLKTAETLDDFLKFSLRQPFTFDFDGKSGSIDDFIAEQKSYYDSKYNQQPREVFEREIDEQFKSEKEWQNRLLFDSGTLEKINQHFPLSVLLETQKSAALPDYLREQFAIVIWTKAIILEDFAVAQKIEPELLKYKPELKTAISQINQAKTPIAKQRAVLYLILKNPILSPFIESALEKTDNDTDTFDVNDWWCAPFDSEYDENGEEKAANISEKPKFLTDAQSLAAQNERKKIKDLGDAPKYLGEKVLEWAKNSPTDKRLPESLYIVYEANGWKKYSCGNNEDLRNNAAQILKKRYPNNEWTQKLETENQ